MAQTIKVHTECDASYTIFPFQTNSPRKKNEKVGKFREVWTAYQWQLCNGDTNGDWYSLCLFRIFTESQTTDS